MSDHYYIDGYNVLHSSALLRPLAQQDFEAARDALLDKVITFCAATHKRVTVVFDGRGKHRPESVTEGLPVRDMEVLYSPSGISADSLIERRVYQEPNRLAVVVVSHDRGLRDLCRGLGALVIDSDTFLESVRELRRDTTAAVEQSQRGNAQAHLDEQISPEERKRLEELRDRLG